MSELDPIALRNAFGAFMTGVTVVTTVDPAGRPIGFTANSFSSVSLDPPLLSVCPSLSMSSFDVFNTCEFFQVSVLGQHQQEISNTFASPIENRFENTQWHSDANGSPVIAGALASFSCKRWESVAAGDHIILLGEVTHFSDREGLGLGYFRGGYFSLDMERRATELQSHAHESDQSVLVGALLEWRGGLILATQDTGKPVLPEVVVKDDQPTFEAIKEYLSDALGVTAKVGSVYSVFENQGAKRSSIYYRVSLDDEQDLSQAMNVEHVELDKLSPDSMGSAAVENMLGRYLSESRTGNHRLYVGTEEKGRTHQLTGEF